MDSVAVKSCSNSDCPCENPQLLDCFSVRKRSRDGRCSQCKTCEKRARNARLRERYASSPERREYLDSYRASNPERVKKWARDYNRRNAEKVAANLTAWRKANPEKVREQSRTAYRRNPEAARRSARERRAANPERYAEALRAWRRANPEQTLALNAKRRAQERNAKGVYTAEHVLAKLELQGGLCYYCGADLDVTGYDVDHKIPLSRGGSNWPANICCACPTCNNRKHAKDFWAFLTEIAA